MISECNDLSIINKFLRYFNIQLKEIATFQKFYIFKENDVEIGMLDFSIIYDRIEINYIYVKNNDRRKNIGTKLINKLIIESNINNCKNISLEVNENNYNAIEFYKKNNFKIVTVRKNYYNNEDAFLMIRELV